MKKFIFAMVAMIATMSMYAQQKVGEYTNSYVSKTFSIEAVEKNNKIEVVYIGIPTDLGSRTYSRSAYIVVKGKDLELFKTALELARDKFSEWKKVAKENNVTEIDKEMGINFPKVTVGWLYGRKWWYSFGNKVNLKFLTLDDGQMVAAWAPTVTSSLNRYIDQEIYFVFGDEEDFNSIIDQLDTQRILNELLNTKNQSDLFH